MSRNYLLFKHTYTHKQTHMHTAENCWRHNYSVAPISASEVISMEALYKYSLLLLHACTFFYACTFFRASMKKRTLKCMIDLIDATTTTTHINIHKILTVFIIDVTIYWFCESQFIYSGHWIVSLVRVNQFVTNDIGGPLSDTTWQPRYRRWTLSLVSL